MTTLSVRVAGPVDADVMGEISVRAWQWAYRGLISPDYLARLDAGERARRWVGSLAAPPPRTCRLIIEEDSRTVGFAAVGPSDDDDEVGELYAINLEPDVVGRGIGTVLLEAATARLRVAHFGNAILWVLPGNARARRFYEARWSARRRCGTRRVGARHRAARTALRTGAVGMTIARQRRLSAAALAVVLVVAVALLVHSRGSDPSSATSTNTTPRASTTIHRHRRRPSPRRRLRRLRRNLRSTVRCGSRRRSPARSRRSRSTRREPVSCSRRT